MKAFKGLAHAISACVVLQAAWIAAGVFVAGKKVDDGKTISSLDDFGNWGFALHSIFAMIIPVLAIALLIVAFVVKVPGAPKWAGYVFGDVVVQWVLAFIAFGVPALGVLHAFNAFIMIGLAETAARKVGVTELPAAAAPASV